MRSYSNDKEIKNSIIENVEKYSCHISLINSDGYNPSFGYTIGLVEKYNHPEIIVLGLDLDSIHSILNNALEKIKEGTRFIINIDYSDFLEELPIRFVEVDAIHYPDYLGYAGWFNKNRWDFKTLQMVWSDRQSSFPWDADFADDLKYKQPLLDRNTDFKFLEPRNRPVFTTQDVLNGNMIIDVYHGEDGNWQFHSSRETDIGQAKIVSLEDLVKQDLSLNNIYYLNYGESATRESKSNEWIIDSKPIRKVINNALNR